MEERCAMREVKNDFRESLADAVLERIECVPAMAKNDTANSNTPNKQQLQITLTLWNEEPAILSFCGAVAWDKTEFEALKGTVLEYLVEQPQDEFLQSVKDAQGTPSEPSSEPSSSSLKSYTVIDFESRPVIRVAAEGVKFYSSSPTLF
ncbi:hypothetical protein MRY87_01825 [bacterium]|nr:hypothetical protein [bacterium]